MNEKYKDLAEKYGLYLLDESELEKIYECNVDAYIDHPLHKWLLGEYFNKDICTKFWKAVIGSIKNEALFIADGPEINGMSIWLPAGFKGMKSYPFLKNGGTKIPMSTYARMITYENYAMNLKKKYTGHESWYLLNMAVRTYKQNMGVATSMMRPMMKFLAESGQSCYLETHIEENVRFYNGFRFNTVEIGKVPNTDIAHFAMKYK